MKVQKKKPSRVSTCSDKRKFSVLQRRVRCFITLPLHQSVLLIWGKSMNILVIVHILKVNPWSSFVWWNTDVFRHYTGTPRRYHKYHRVIKHGPHITWMMKRWIQCICVFTSMHPDCPLSDSVCLLLSLPWLLGPPACSLFSSRKFCSCSFLLRMRAAFSASV